MNISFGETGINAPKDINQTVAVSKITPYLGKFIHYIAPSKIPTMEQKEVEVVKEVHDM